MCLQKSKISSQLEGRDIKMISKIKKQVDLLEMSHIKTCRVGKCLDCQFFNQFLQ
jgi:hypothetical protein